MAILICILSIACEKSDNNDNDEDQDDDQEDDDQTLEDEMLIPAGKFFMGCEEDDTRCEDDESPRHEVYLDAYYIDVYEVTNQQYANYLNSRNPENICDDEYGVLPCIVVENSDEKKDFYGIYWEDDEWKVDEGYEDRPVTDITWDGATKYCQSLEQRLPTEAEWERAAKVFRTGDSTFYNVYPWGDGWKPNAANWNYSEDPYEGLTYPATSPVGYFDGLMKDDDYQTADGSTPGGLYDMAGNAAEWVYDWYHPMYYNDPPEGGWENPQGPSWDDAYTWGDMGPYHVVRGGDFYSAAPYLLRSTERGITVVMDTTTGFRCARDAE
ncbi:MAG: SUMF1/EgtB/PvdO family nonheme iron enzyme [Candidatus Alcyoniella australis]|nr:SUMF1/EgtB/PvdO family nonheme iron enzyme [Candidatus Alcyoniella australis]